MVLWGKRQELYIDCPWNWPISSDYGPRIKPTSDASWFHTGIDYAGPYGADILSVEDGVIDKIIYDGGWRVYIKNDYNRWLYMHMFSGGGESKISGNYEVRNETLEHPETHEIINNETIIIYWDSSKTRAKKIYVRQKYAGYWVQNGKQIYIWDLTGNTAITSATVTKEQWKKIRTTNTIERNFR